MFTVLSVLCCVCCFVFKLNTYPDPPKASLRTGSTFDGLVSYVAAHGQVMHFVGWENVSALASKPQGIVRHSDGDLRSEIIGPSNLASCAHILLKRTAMWSHIWQLDPCLFGAGQGRLRLWGSSHFLRNLSMDKSSAHGILNSTMNQLAGVAPCDPELHLLPEDHELMQENRRMHALRALQKRGQDSDDSEGGVGLGNMNKLLMTGGVVARPQTSNAKVRNDDAYNWPAVHAQALAEMLDWVSEMFRFLAVVVCYGFYKF
jgi:hypothetical protein